MYCKHCGEQIPDGSKFCSKCGKSLVPPAQPAQAAPTVNAAPAQPVQPAQTVQPQPATPPANKSKKGGKKILIAVIAAVLALALVGGVIALIASLAGGKMRGGNFSLADESAAFFVGENNDTLCIVNSDCKLIEVEKGRLKDSSSYLYKTDASGKKAVIAVALKDGKYKLLYFDGNGVSDIVSTDQYVFGDLIIASGGNGVAYTLHDVEKNETGAYLFDGKKTEKIASDAEITAISPDGKTVCYRKLAKEDGSYTGDYRGVYYTGGDEHDIGSGCSIFAVANGAKFIYFWRESNSGDYTVYVQKKDNEDSRVKVLTSDDTVNACVFNRDYSQAVYQVEDKGTFLVKNGSDPVKLTSKECSPLIPDGTAFSYSDKTDVEYFTVGVDDFEDKNLCWTSFDHGYTTRIMKLTADGTETIVSGDELYHVVLRNDGRTVLYAKDGRLMSVDTGAKDPEPVELLDITGVANWDTTLDGEVIFYTDDFNDLYAIKGSGKAVKVKELDSDAVHTLQFFKSRVYFIFEKELYSSDGGKATKITSAGTGIEYIAVKGSVLLCQNSDYEIFCSSDGKNFTKIYTFSAN